MRSLLNLHLCSILSNRNPGGLDGYNVFMYFMKHLALVSRAYCIGIRIFLRTYLAYLPNMLNKLPNTIDFLADLVSYHLLACTVSAKDNDFFSGAR